MNARTWSLLLCGLPLAGFAQDSAPRGELLPLQFESHLLDVRFHEFMEDEIATAERVLAWAGEPVDEDARQAVRAFAVRNVRGKHGTIAYPLEDIGLEADELRKHFRFYQDYFALPDDG